MSLTKTTEEQKNEFLLYDSCSHTQIITTIIENQHNDVFKLFLSTNSKRTVGAYSRS